MAKYDNPSTPPHHKLTLFRIKTISLAIISKFKAENPDFDLDFEAFVKDLSTEEVVRSPDERGN